MLSLEGDVEAHALREQGWSISAIARHLGVNRKTVRAYLAGERTPGQRQRSEPPVIEPFVDYCRIRLADDPHWATAFGDATVAAAMLDRLLHRATVVGIDGPSYRLRNHQATAETMRKAVAAHVS